MTEPGIQRFFNDACLMDDLLFELFFRDDPKYIEFVVREIFNQLNKPMVKIVSVSVSHTSEPDGESIPKLDLIGEDEKGEKVYMEVYLFSGPYSPVRARCYSALLDMKILPEGGTDEDLPQTYIIFIMEEDIRGKGLPAYLVGRAYVDNRVPVNDGSTFIYLNGKYRGDDPIGRLMNDFHSKTVEAMKNKELAERMRFFKETSTGRNERS